MKCNRDSGFPYRVISLISSAKLEWISVSSSLPYKPQGREEFQDLLDMWKYLGSVEISHERKSTRWSKNKRAVEVNLLDLNVPSISL